MRRFLSAGLIRIVSAFAAFSVAVASGQVQNQSSAASTSAPAMMQMPIVAPLFVEDGDFTSTLILVNGSSVSTYADVALRAPDGQTVATQRVQLPPHNQQQVGIRALLQTGTAPNLTTGSVTVMQSPDVSPMVVVAALSITQQSSSTPHYIDQELAMPSPTGSQILRGVADRSDGSPLVAIASLSDMPQHVTIACLGAAHSEASTVTLAPDATILTPACTGHQNENGDLHWLAENLPNTPHRPVGIALTSDAMPGSFAAFGLAPHDSPDGRYFSSVSFTDPKTLLSTTSVFTGVPVGSSPLLPEGKYAPVAALANFSQSARHVTVSYALTQNGTPSLRTVKSITLAPMTSREVALDGLPGDPMLQDSFLVQSDGSPGDVQSKLVSRSDNSRLREVELLAKDLDDPENGGDHPWTIADGVTSTLLLFNESSKPQWFNVHVAAGAKVWRKSYQLQPNQTLAINFNDLRKAGAKDNYGETFPKDIWSGQVGWSVPQKNAGRGRLLQSNPETAMARSFSCGEVMELCGADIAYLYNYILDGQTVDFGTIEIQTCLNTCNGTPGGSGEFGYSYEWNSENSNVASISGDNSNQSANVFGASPGGTYIDANVWDAWCQIGIYPSPPATVGPMITGISPSTWQLGVANLQVTITGAGFGTAPTINLPSGATVASVQSVSDSKIVFSVAVAFNATIGNTNMSVSVGSNASNPEQVSLDGPYKLIVEGDNTGLCNGCTTTVARQVTYQMEDFSNTASTGDLTICENPTFSDWNCQGGNMPTATVDWCPNIPGQTAHPVVAQNNAQFIDGWSLSSDGWGQNGCGFNITDTWYWLTPTTSTTDELGIASGYVHTDAVEIDGYTSTLTQKDPIPDGTIMPR